MGEDHLPEIGFEEAYAKLYSWYISNRGKFDPEVEEFDEERWDFLAPTPEDGENHGLRESLRLTTTLIDHLSPPGEATTLEKMLILREVVIGYLENGFGYEADGFYIGYYAVAGLKDLLGDNYLGNLEAEEIEGISALRILPHIKHRQ